MSERDERHASEAAFDEADEDRSGQTPRRSPRPDVRGPRSRRVDA